MMGSCFTENIGKIMERYLFPLHINPFGVTYNPLSVHKGLDALLHKPKYKAGDLYQHDDLWFSFDHDTGFSTPDPERTLELINGEFIAAKKRLEKAAILIITWGTAWVFSYNATGKVVCNCHKIPAGEFTRFRLTVGEIVEQYHALLEELFSLNNNLKVLITVSPVRHWKDGAHGNQLSKSTLLLAGEELTSAFPGQVFYFPSYEIVMDELRDYRFYAEDLLHTGENATQFIWEKFRRALVHEESRQIIMELDPLLRMTAHRPLHPESEAHRKMIRSQQAKLRDLQKRYPFLPLNKLEIK
jgi:hypothetical protein